MYALVLTIDELRKFNCKSKTKQCRTPHEVYYIQPSLASDNSIVCCQECFLYTYTGVGLLRCSFRLTGQCEGLSIVERVTEQAPRFFVCISEWISSTRESVGFIVYGIRMNILQNNPYRLLGVYSNSPTKERLANHNRMKAFLKVGKSVSFPLDVPQYLSSINRTESSAADAEAKLTLPKDQILHAQFWFIKTTPLDEVAFNHLFAGEIDKAEEIWQKRECASSLQNLIVCALMCGKYAEAISLAETLYSNTQYINQLVAAVVGMGGNFNVSDLTFSFIDVLCDEIGTNKLLSFITNATWKDYIKDKAVKPIISHIQDAIDVAHKSKGKGATARLEAGRTLMRSTKDMLSDLRRLLSVSDIQYEVIADKLAQEILQCGIDYYNNTNDDDAPHNAMILQKYALSVAVGNLVKNRCKENVDTLEKVGPEYAVRNEITFLMNIVKQLRSKGGHDKYSIIFGLGHSISDVQGLVEKSMPYINRMKEKLGSSDDLYIKVTSAVVSAAVNAIVEIINMQQTLSLGNADRLKPVISAAISAMGIIGNIDMDTMTRQYYNRNNSTLVSMNRRRNPSDDGACYIATMAYGDYEHPQVLILRHFRDLYLAQRNWGKWFIKTYYKYSPKLVEKLKNHTFANKFIRKSLDGFISCIKNKYK